MPKETLPHTSPDLPRGSYFPSTETLSTVGWKVANFAVGMLATSVALTVVRSPLESLMLDSIKPGCVLPPSMRGRGLIAAARIFYAGSGPSFATSNVKTLYTAGTATVKKGESAGREEVALTQPSQTNKYSQFGLVAVVAAGYVAISQYETKGLLVKLKITPEGFNWRTQKNGRHLATTALGARYSSALISFSALFLLEKKVSDLMPGGNESLNHALAGGVSGLVSSMLSLPSNLYRYHVLANSTVKGGDWIPPSAKTIASETVGYIKSIGAKEAATQAAQLYTKHLPKYAIMTAIR